METNEIPSGYEYSYSSRKQQEIESLREKYAQAMTQDDVLMQMRELDRQVEKSASRLPVILGSIGMLLLACGMCLTMAMSSTILFIIGIVIGVPGIALAGIAYPLYLKNIRKERAKAAPRMLELAEQQKG